MRDTGVNSFKKILLLRFSSIGDIVLTSPVIRVLATRYPDAEIHYATKKQFASLLQHHPSLHTLHLLEKAHKKQFEEQLIHEGFDLVVDLHNNLRTRLLLYKIKCKVVIKFDKLNRQKWLAVRTGNVSVLPKKHLVDRYFDALKKIGVENDGKGLDFYTGATTLSEDIRANLPAEPYLAIAIGGQHATKRFPLNQWIRVLSRSPYPVVILGGVGDMEMAEAIVQNLPSPQMVNLCGQLSITESALVIQNAVKIITNDTGLMHIAAAFELPIISLWGNTVPEFGMYPYFKENSSSAMQSHRLEVKGLACRPCSKIGFEICPQGHFDCMNKIEWNDSYF